MKTVDKKKLKKPKNKSKPIPKQKVLIVAQELKFARLLAGNEKKSRDRVLKALKKWLLNCFEKSYEFKEEDFIRVWKGLFYAVWMSDKPLVQEELCENISETLDLFPAGQYRHALLMMKAGFRVLATEWYGIDQHRMDKFLMLVRRYLRGCLRTVGRQEWSVEGCRQFADMLSTGDGLFAIQTPLYARNAISLLMHICDCYLEEIAKTSRGRISESSLVELLLPFLKYMSGGRELRVISSARRILNQLIRQTDAGLEYHARRRAWERMGCPEGGPDALQRESDDDDDDEEKQSDDDNDDDIGALDPRAGRVSTSLPPLPPAGAPLAAALRRLLRTAAVQHQTRLRKQAERFEALSRNEYPLKVPCPPSPPPTAPTTPSRAAAALSSMEKQLMSDPTDMALRGLSRKHRKRLLARSRAGHSIVEELAVISGASSNSATTNGNWQVEEAEPPSRDTDKENRHRDKQTKKRTNTDKSTPSPPKKVKLDLNIKSKDRSKANKQGNVQALPVKSDDKTDKLKGLKEKPKKSEKLKIIITDNSKKVKETKQPESPKKSPEPTKPKENAKKRVSPNEKAPLLVVNKVKNFQKQILPPKSDKKAKRSAEISPEMKNLSFSTPKKVKFVLKNNSMQETMDYYKSVRQSPNIPYDGTKKPTKTNLKPNSTPSPINPFFKKKLRLKK